MAKSNLQHLHRLPTWPPGTQSFPHLNLPPAHRQTTTTSNLTCQRRQSAARSHTELRRPSDTLPDGGGPLLLGASSSSGLNLLGLHLQGAVFIGCPQAVPSAVPQPDVRTLTLDLSLALRGYLASATCPQSEMPGGARVSTAAVIPPRVVRLPRHFPQQLGVKPLPLSLDVRLWARHLPTDSPTSRPPA